MVQDYSTIIVAILGISGTLLGTILGYLLNKRSHREEKKDQIKSTRMLIGLEIDKNLEMLNILWFEANQLDSEEDMIVSEEDDEDGDNHKINLAYKLADLNLPPLTNESWKSQLSFVPIALNKNEIKIINDFYSDLYVINSIYSSLLALISKDEENSRTRQLMPTKGFNFWGLGLVFHDSAPVLWEKFEKITLKLIENKNPLKEFNQIDLK